MKRLFEIQTLSERNTRLNGYTRLSQDPGTIITGGLAIITSLFPNLFGGNRRRLTQADWLTLFPGQGYWTTALRAYLSNSIKYDTDLNMTETFTRYFVDENAHNICSEYGVQGGSPPMWHNQNERLDCIQKFLNILRQEKATGGSSPIGNLPGGFGAEINWNGVLLIGGGVLLLVTLMNKKKKSRK